VTAAPDGAGPAADEAELDADEAELVAGMARLAARGRQPDPPTVLSRRADRLVLRCADVVLKAHARDADPQTLAARLRVATRPDLAEVLLAPRDAGAATVGGRLVSVWPVGHALGPADADAAPWERAGALLARLHTAPVGLGALGSLPPANVLRRLADRVTRLRGRAGHPLVDQVLAAAGTLGEPSAAAGPGRPTTLVHGDFHFGQLVALPGAGWRIIDVDDLGLGDPAWDLARPAAWFAAGLLAGDRWAGFLDAYTAHGGPAVPADRAGPWPALDLPARALTVEYAATALAACLESGEPLDEASDALVVACGRIADADVAPASSSRLVER